MKICKYIRNTKLYTENSVWLIVSYRCIKCGAVLKIVPNIIKPTGRLYDGFKVRNKQKLFRI